LAGHQTATPRRDAAGAKTAAHDDATTDDQATTQQLEATAELEVAAVAAVARDEARTRDGGGLDRGMAAAIRAGDRSVQRLGQVTAAPRLLLEAEARAVDARALLALAEQLAEVAVLVGRKELVSPAKVLGLGATAASWAAARGINDPTAADPAAAERGG
jgi:hypothetical protein